MQNTRKHTGDSEAKYPWIAAVLAAVARAPVDISTHTVASDNLTTALKESIDAHLHCLESILRYPEIS